MLVLYHQLSDGLSFHRQASELKSRLNPHIKLYLPKSPLESSFWIKIAMDSVTTVQLWNSWEESDYCYSPMWTPPILYKGIKLLYINNLATLFEWDTSMCWFHGGYDERYTQTTSAHYIWTCLAISGRHGTVQRCSGAAVQWCSGAAVQWCSGAAAVWSRCLVSGWVRVAGWHVRWLWDCGTVSVATRDCSFTVSRYLRHTRPPYVR